MISRRRLLHVALVSGGIIATGGYLSLDDTEAEQEIASLPLKFMTASEATIMALLMTAILDQTLLEQDEITAWLLRIDEALAYLPDSQQHELLMLLDTLTNKLGRLVLTANMSSWQSENAEIVAHVLEKWRHSSLEILNMAYIGVKQLIMAVWYGERDSWLDINYSGPPG